MEKKRILTGDRTTGPLHLGHLVGSLQNRVRLQDEYDTFILLADVQALTTHYQNPALMAESIYQVAIDNLAAGLDPEKITLIQQSRVAAIAELTVFYSMLVSVNVLRHNPTVKTEAAQYGYNDLTYGFLGYPVSQAADITFCNADLVPVGGDQLPHMELARKIARRFNELYAQGGELVKVPRELLSATPRLPGLDGNSKMGKSLGNAVYLSDDVDTVDRKIHSAVTDVNRIAVTDRGNPDICTVYAYHKAFNEGEQADISHMCRSAQIGCVACKKRLAAKLNELLAPMREKRAYYGRHRDEVRALILAGSEKANRIGNETMDRAREAMRLAI
ncbi:MAG TPA: tryptophan--tRNA ligase [Clostridia bacterium]|nr:tryptophan--tRNA ligase [Clostridia bacterium]